MAKSMEKQAERLLASRHLSLSSRHAAKSGSAGSSGKIHSMSTFQRYCQALSQAGKWARDRHGVRRLDDLTPALAGSYLDHRRLAGIGQKQLDNDRNALSFVTGKLDRVLSDQKPVLEGRAYSRDEVELIARRQASHNALATRIAFDAGLRAHELLTLRRADEDSPSSSREWRLDRFLGRSGERYVVTGKGGLAREVLLSHGLSRALERCRLDQPRQVTDRGIYYQSHYDLGGGVAWSMSFTTCSKRALGLSRGAHGLRHGYAHERLAELQARGLGEKDARQILSQELGHFRPEIVEVYLR